MSGRIAFWPVALLIAAIAATSCVARAASSGDGVIDFGPPLVDDALPRPPIPLSITDLGAPSGQSRAQTSAYIRAQTSAYMVGKVAVSIIMPESDGSIDLSTEDWSPDRQATVVDKIESGLAWWASRYPYEVAPLSFVFDVQYPSIGSEPIQHPRAEEGLWISEAMTALGRPCDASTYITAVLDHDNDLRDSNHTDWAFTIFVVDSLNEITGSFDDGSFAYAYLGGPFLVMTYRNAGWGIANMDRVAAHETGHVFGAGDEYCQTADSCCDPNAYYGYLSIENTNCNTHVTCLMELVDWALCSVSKAQVGWRDLDGDGVPDVLDMPPTVSLSPIAPNPAEAGAAAISGAAAVTCYPNRISPGQDVTLNRIAGVQYRLDGGEWKPCQASDGAFDGGGEQFGAVVDLAPLGVHTLELQAIDTSGNTGSAIVPRDFTDVGPETWGGAQICACRRAGIANGYGDGRFDPTGVVTRDQMAAYVSRALAGGDAHVPSGPVRAAFSDVPTWHWAYRYVEFAKLSEVVTGYPDGLYHPGAVLDRGQMAVVLARAIVRPTGEAGLAGFTLPATPRFADVTATNAWAWCFRHVEYIAERGVTQGYPDKLYHPEYACTRDQMAVFVTRAFGVE